MNPLRSVVFSFGALIQIVLCYAYFYSLCFRYGALTLKERSEFSVMEAVFYSVGTIATVGYGFLEPTGWLAELIVSSELVLGLYFIVIILAQVSAWTNQSNVELGTFRWDDVKE